MTQNLNNLNKTIFIVLFVLVPFLSIGQRLTTRRINKIIEKSEILKQHFVGLAIYDEDKKKMIYQYNADKHFTPASNTKLYTLYTALYMLGDSIPALKYTIKNDSLLFWGTGDPTLDYDVFKSTKVLDFLKKTTKKLYFISNNYRGDFYGYGWNYDDYNEYFQPELNSFPIQGNIATVTIDEKGNLQVKPKLFEQNFKENLAFTPKEFTIKRDLFSNNFTLPYSKPTKKYKQQIPFKISPETTISILEEKTNREITLIDIKLPEDFKIIYSEKTDDVLKVMMLTSDNFIAEQILLVCASTLSNNLNTSEIIEYSKTHFMNDISINMVWVDGSGLSRYNLITPNTTIAILQKIKSKIDNEDRLHSLFPTGGITGTLKRAYKMDGDKPFVWAKTGTLTNNYNQSGYLNTRKGKKLIFSFMNNNFLPDASEIRTEMVRIMTEIHNNY